MPFGNFSFWEIILLMVAVLLLFGAKRGPEILFAGQYWRLVTAGFLHGGVMHILMNSWVLFDLSRKLPTALSRPVCGRSFGTK